MADRAGKFLGVLDLDLGKGAVKDVRYHLLPVYRRSAEGRSPRCRRSSTRQRKPHAAAFDEKLGGGGRPPLPPRQFQRHHGSGDLRRACARSSTREIALSPGFRWGNTMLPGEPITMEDVLSETAITYPEVYVQEMTGAQIKAIMEDICDNLFNPDPYYQQGGDMVRIGGMDYACAPAESVGNRISDMTLDSGKTLDAGKTYKVAGWASVNPQQGKPVVGGVCRIICAGERPRKPKKLNRSRSKACRTIRGFPARGRHEIIRICCEPSLVVARRLLRAPAMAQTPPHARQAVRRASPGAAALRRRAGQAAAGAQRRQ